MVVTSSNFTRFGQAGIEMNNRSGTASLTVQDSYFAEIPGWPQPYHVDGIQVGAGENVTIQHNTVLVPQYGGSQGDTSYVSNSVLGLWAELGNVTGTVTVEGNLLAGGGVCRLHRAERRRMLGRGRCGSSTTCSTNVSGRTVASGVRCIPGAYPPN